MKYYVTKDGEVYTDESALQIDCVNWFRATYPQYERLFFAIPNGGKMAGRMVNGVNIQASRMKREGIVAGVADLFLSVGVVPKNGLYFEMKTPIGKWSDEQKAFCLSVINAGYAYALCRRRKDFEAIVKSYLNNTYKQIWTLEDIDRASGRKQPAKKEK